MAFYSDPQSEVLNMAQMIGVGTGLADKFTTTQINSWQQRADDIINFALQARYETPIKQITRNSITAYPPPLAEVARRLAAYYLIVDTFTEIEPNLSESNKNNKLLADEMLSGLLDQGSFLLGQRRRAANPGSNPWTEPALPGKQSKEPTTTTP